MSENNTTQMSFRRGERLSADKMNRLAGMAMAALSPRSPVRPGGDMSFRGDARWSSTSPVVEQVGNKPRFKPFDICPQWDTSGKLSAYVVMRPMWQVFEDNEAKVMELSGDVTLKHEGGMDSVSAIYLVQLSAEEDSSESEGGEGEGEESEDEGDWKVLDNVGLQEEDRTIQNKWLLYKVGGNGLVTLDVRDAFVNLQLSSDVSADASVELDLSSLNYDDEEKIQNWNYKAPVAEDLIDLEISAMGGYRFLTRPEEGGSLKYASLSAAFNDLSSEISALSAEISAGGSTTITGNVNGSVAIDGDIQVMAMLSSNVSCETLIDPNTGDHIMKLGVYYLGWMLPLFTMLVF